MGIQLPDIEFKSIIHNPTIDSCNSDYEIPFYKNSDYFSNWENFCSFINAVEKAVRHSRQYKRYIAHLKKDVGLTVCQVLSNVTDEMAEIEMHHGPILTLFDYITIVVEQFLYDKKKINTFIIADVILQEHFNYNIQTVMLTKTAHEEVHEFNVFLNYRHGFGNLNNFIKKYRNGISDDILNKINNYIRISQEKDSYEKGVFDLSNAIEKWVKT